MLRLRRQRTAQHEPRFRRFRFGLDDHREVGALVERANTRDATGELFGIDDDEIGAAFAFMRGPRLIQRGAGAGEQPGQLGTLVFGKASQREAFHGKGTTARMSSTPFVLQAAGHRGAHSRTREFHARFAAPGANPHTVLTLAPGTPLLLSASDALRTLPRAACHRGRRAPRSGPAPARARRPALAKAALAG